MPSRLRTSPWSLGPSQWIWHPLVPPTPPVPPNLPMLTPTSYVVPQFMTRCCHPRMLVHAVPHISPHLEIVPSLLIAPSSWMSVSSGRTATANDCVPRVRHFLGIILYLYFTESGKAESRERKEGDSKEFPEGGLYTSYTYHKGKITLG